MTAHDRRLWAVLVTFRRPEAVREMLGTLNHQTRVPDVLVVVDNDGGDGTALTRAATSLLPGTEVLHVPQATNLGPAGGFAAGLELVRDLASDDEWVLLLDDDDPPLAPDTIEQLVSMTQALPPVPPCGAVGVVGARLDRGSGRMVRLPDDELAGPVRVDSVGGNHQPLIRVRALRDALHEPQLFFGHEELEFSLRLQRAGWSIWSHGPLHRDLRAHYARLDRSLAPTRQLEAPTWRRYYSVRNMIWLLRREGCHAAAARVSAERLAKVALALPTDRAHAWAHARLTLRAVADGWMGHLGPRGIPAATYDGGRASARARTREARRLRRRS